MGALGATPDVVRLLMTLAESHAINVSYIGWPVNETPIANLLVVAVLNTHSSCAPSLNERRSHNDWYIGAYLLPYSLQYRS